MPKLVECVPNFSEGRDQPLIDKIVSAVKTTKVLDVHSDPDHNRSVVTMLGDPVTIKQAAFDLTERAVQILDIRKHTGVHPFIGVMDVVPFVPLKGISEQEVCAIAWQFGEEVASKLALPVYFYGAACRKNKFRHLPDVRRGGEPDLGQGRHPTAGAVAVGVRDVLIAFNVNLNTPEVAIARSIARDIRRPLAVRALGVPLESRGIAQVTMNLIDHQKASLKQVFDAIKKLAAKYGVEILASEIVGMLPEDAVFPGMEEYLHLTLPPRVFMIR